MSEYIPSAKLRVFLNESGNLCASIEGRAEWERVSVRRAFPYSDPRRYVALYDGDDEIGVIEDMDAVEPASRAVLEENLDRRYFIPVIERIIEIEEIRKFTRWHVQTDVGIRQFEVLNRRSFRRLPGGGMIIVDVDANRFRIPDRNALDERSRGLLDLHC
jgi:hypothetical protein